ncbi:MAG: hypothetical protein Q9208_007170 [Pyrenodesmia sp. 3 TL-2023]
MASLLIAGGFLTYEKIAAKRAKRAERKAEKKAYDRKRFSELEAENAARIRALQEKTEFCGRSDWDRERGGGCGGGGGGVPAAGRNMGGGPAAQATLNGGDAQGGQQPVLDRREEGEDADRSVEGRTSEEARRGRRTSQEENPFAATTTSPSSIPSSIPFDSAQSYTPQQPLNQHDLNRAPTSATTGSTENTLLDSYARSHEQDDAERELQVPDVRGVMPVYRDDKVCRKSLKQRVLRRRGPCEGGGQTGR